MRILLARCGLVLLILCLVNCGTWHATQAPLVELEGKHVRVTAKDGKRQEGKLVDADSLGFAVLQVAPEFENRAGFGRFAKPAISTFDTTTIAVVEKRVWSPTRTASMVLIPVAIVFGLVVRSLPALGGED